MRELNFNPNRWHPVAGTDDLVVNQVSRAILLGQETALWRDSEGQAHAVENRCVHRGLRLSKGFVRDGKLCCGYHRWQYGGDGQCKYIPAQPDRSPHKSIKVSSRRICERAGLIWLSYCDEPVSSEVFNKLESLGSAFFCRSIHIDSQSEDIYQYLLHKGVGNGQYQCSELALGFVLLKRDAEIIVIALQFCSEEKTSLHFLTFSEREDRHIAERKEQVARLAIDLRRVLENIKK